MLFTQPGARLARARAIHLRPWAPPAHIKEINICRFSTRLLHIWNGYCNLALLFDCRYSTIITTNTSITIMKAKNEAAEAMTQYGVKHLSDLQLLTVLGIPETAARELLTVAEGNLATIAKMSPTAVKDAVKTITQAKANIVTAAIELGRRRQIEPAIQRTQVTSSADIHAFITPQMQDLTQEEFWIVLLDRRSRVLRTEMIHRGGMSSMVVDPKIVFQRALECKAQCVVLIHNHPSGAPSPSMEDIRLTEKIKSAGSFIDIKVLDHIIVGDQCYYSFADEGKM